MKILAYKPHGGSIVEFGERETELLNQLSSAMAGELWQAKVPRGYEVEGDMEKAFLAIIYFIQVKFAVNEIRKIADVLRWKYRTKMSSDAITKLLEENDRQAGVYIDGVIIDKVDDLNHLVGEKLIVFRVVKWLGLDSEIKIRLELKVEK